MTNSRKPNLFVGADLFYPAAYRSPDGGDEAAEYGESADFVWVVLQPALVKGGDTLQLKEYMGLAEAAVAGSAVSVKFIDDKTGLPQDQTIPVPFPPGTTLVLTLDGVGPKFTASRTLQAQHLQVDPPPPPSDDALLLPTAQWPQFAAASLGLPMISSYADLDLIPDKTVVEGYKTEILTWGMGLATTVLKRAKDNLPLTAAEKKAHEILKPLEEQINAATRPLTEKEMRDTLSPLPPAASPVAQLWDAMLRPEASDDGIMAPRYQHTEDSLKTNPSGLLGLSDPTGSRPDAVSFLGRLWWEMGEILKRQNPPAPKPANADTVENAFKRLFGFGERRRWPSAKIKSSPEAFMIIDEKTPGRVGKVIWDAQATNAHSLLGLAFRLPIKAGADVSHAVLSINVMGQALPDLAPALKALMTEVNNTRPRFAAEVGRDADRPDGFFYFLPKMAEGAKAASPLGDKVFGTPAALLDAVDSDARWSMVGSKRRPKRPTLVYETPPRIGLREGELFKADVLTGAAADRRLNIKVQISSAPLAVAQAHRIDQETRLHDDEDQEVRERFLQLAVSGDDAFVWGRQKDGTTAAWEIKKRVIHAGAAGDRVPHLIVEDPDGTLQKLLDNLDNPEDQLDVGGRPAVKTANLIFAAAPNSLFNLQANAAKLPLFVLHDVFTSRLSTCADRLMDRFQIKTTPFFDPDPAHADPQLAGSLMAHFSNFNKLRLRIVSDHPEVVALHEDPWMKFDFKAAGLPVTKLLTYPDAVVPLGSAGYTPSTPPWLAAPVGSKVKNCTYGYFIASIFTQDAKADENATPELRNEAEALRYQNYLTPEIPWALGGYIEHQYSYRISLKEIDLPLKLASDITHVGATTIKTDDDAPGGAPMIRWSFDSKTSVIRLEVIRTYLKLALDDSKAVQGSGYREHPRPARLRAIYEPLAELVTAVDHGEAKLKLERWVFDSDLQFEPNEARSNAMSQNMRLASSHELRLQKAGPGLASLGEVRRLLGLPLTHFESELATIAQAAGDIWLTFDIPFDGSWTVSGETFSGPLFAASDVLRLGLLLIRKDDRVVDDKVVADPLNVPGFPLPVDPDVAAQYPGLDADALDALKQSAAKELGSYLKADSDSRLRKSFAFLQVIPPPQPPNALPANGTSDPDAARGRRPVDRIFGSLAPYLLVPEGARPALENVVDIFYVPFAFRPLAVHSLIGDVEATFEFAEYTLQILGDLLAGRKPNGIDVGPATPGEAIKIIAGLAQDVVPTVAKNLVELLHWVHNDVEGAPPPASAPTFWRADNLAKTVFYAASGAKLAFNNLFVTNPALYTTSKAFGLALFEPRTWSDRLHSLKVIKNINHADTSVKGSAPRVDTDIFVFDALEEAQGINYFLDVLDDVRYDNQFEIAASTFRPDRTLSVPVKAVTMTGRGAVEARSGEDIIEAANLFGAGPANRQIEADAVAWNVRWHDPSTDTNYYLLPSRRFPARPVKVKARAVRAEGAAAWSDVNPRRSDLELDFGVSPIDLKTQLAALLDDIRKSNAVVAIGDPSGGNTGTTELVADHGFCKAYADALGDVTSWWRQESYASEHYFVVEPDEEYVPGVTKPFDNDLFRIEVEMHDTAPVDEPETTPAETEVPGALGAWFIAQRKRINGERVDNPPGAISLKDLDRELRSWLAPADSRDNLLKGQSAPTAKANGSIASTSTTYQPSKPRLHTPAASKMDIGCVLAAELLELSSGKGSTPGNAVRFVFRVVILDECWSFSRVRVRIERNSNDVDGDNISDINPTFLTMSDFSAWSTHGREPLVRDFTAMAHLKPPSEIACIMPMSVNDFLLKPQPLNYGDPIPGIMQFAFKDSGVSRDCWNHNRALGAGLTISGMLVQRRRDLHPRFSTAQIAKPEPSREEDIPRVHLPTVPADNSKSLMTNINGSDLLSLHHDAVITWSTQSGAEPLLVCRWPVKFS